MTTLPLRYCPSCEIFVRARGGLCARCSSPTERKTFEHAEDVFGPPAPGERPASHARPTERGSAGLGFAFLMLLHFAGQPVLSGLVGSAVPLMMIGVSQLLYVIPAAIVLAVTGQGKTLAGLWIGAAITFGLNGLCWGVLCGGVSGP